MIEEGSVIMIEKVGNGFIVRQPPRFNEAIIEEDSLVFNTTAQLAKFVKNHFSDKKG